jgi:hypothetical protein
MPFDGVEERVVSQMDIGPNPVSGAVSSRRPDSGDREFHSMFASAPECHLGSMP